MPSDTEAHDRYCEMQNPQQEPQDMPPDYTAKIDKILDRCRELGFTERDFAQLALAAADQSGISAGIQEVWAEDLGLDPVRPYKEQG